MDCTNVACYDWRMWFTIWKNIFASIQVIYLHMCKWWKFCVTKIILHSVIIILKITPKKKKNIEMFWLNYKLPNWLFPFHNLLPNINILGTFTSSINLAKTNKCSNSSCPFYISTSFTGAQTQMQLFLNDSEANTINMTRLWTQECYLKTYVF